MLFVSREDAKAGFAIFLLRLNTYILGKTFHSLLNEVCTVFQQKKAVAFFENATAFLWTQLDYKKQMVIHSLYFFRFKF
jgi:hypothetical protein